MAKNLHNRLEASQIPPESLEKLNAFLTDSSDLALTNDSGNRTELPAPLMQHLIRIVRLMSENRTIVFIPEDETFTTQAAANYLGVSRQFFVNILESNEIPYHKVGTHRRVLFKDLLSYEKRRDAGRRATLDRLMKSVDDAGLYDAAYTGDL